MQKPPVEIKTSPRLCPLFGDRLYYSCIRPARLVSGQVGRLLLHTKWLYLVGLLFGAVVGFWQVIRMALGALTTTKMNDAEHLDGAAESLPPDPSGGISSGEASLGEATLIERIIPRMLRNILVVSVLLLGPMFWYDRWRERLGLPLGRPFPT